MKIVNGKSSVEIDVSEIIDIDVGREKVERNEESNVRITTYAVVFKTKKLDYFARYTTDVLFFEEIEDEFMSILYEKVKSMIEEFAAELKDGQNPKSQVIDVERLFEKHINIACQTQLKIATIMYSESRAAGIEALESGSYGEDYEDEGYDEDYDDDYEDECFCDECKENLQFERFFERMVPRIKELIEEMKINGSDK